VTTHPSLPAFAIGSVLDGRYRLDALLAEGGFGAVYRATHLATGCDVAVKLLRLRCSANGPTATRFRREGELLARLRHPSTVMTYETGVANGTLYIAMELLRGETLCTRLSRDGAFGWHQAVTIARDICAALAEAHELGIVHRDLKPANIHLEAWPGGPELVKIIDFGIAKILRTSPIAHGDELTFAGQVIGTPEYMAPEQIVGDEVDHRADIYALGVLLFEMLTGRRPFEITNGNALLSLLVDRAPVRPSRVLPYAAVDTCSELDRIVMRCLADSPDDRYQSIGELAAALEVLLHHALPGTTLDATVTAVRVVELPPRRAARGSRAPLHVDELERTGRVQLRRRLG
jgi:eukaryotic-like serine/threonine-protein kinase